jgi:hypothetical protein
MSNIEGLEGLMEEEKQFWNPHIKQEIPASDSPMIIT